MGDWYRVTPLVKRTSTERAEELNGRFVRQYDGAGIEPTLVFSVSVPDARVCVWLSCWTHLAASRLTRVGNGFREYETHISVSRVAKIEAAAPVAPTKPPQPQWAATGRF